VVGKGVGRVSPSLTGRYRLVPQPMSAGRGHSNPLYAELKVRDVQVQLNKGGIGPRVRTKACLDRRHNSNQLSGGVSVCSCLLLAR